MGPIHKWLDDVQLSGCSHTHTHTHTHTHLPRYKMARAFLSSPLRLSSCEWFKVFCWRNFNLDTLEKNVQIAQFYMIFYTGKKFNSTSKYIPTQNNYSSKKRKNPFLIRVIDRPQRLRVCLYLSSHPLQQLFLPLFCPSSFSPPSLFR